MTRKLDLPHAVQAALLDHDQAAWGEARVTAATYPVELWNHQKRDFVRYESFSHLPPGHTLYPHYGVVWADVDTVAGVRCHRLRIVVWDCRAIVNQRLARDRTWRLKPCFLCHTGAIFALRRSGSCRRRSIRPRESDILASHRCQVRSGG